MSKHTDGPWLIDVANYHAGHIATVDHNGHVMEIWSETWPKSEDGPGNAKLIAAAPELLEALQDLWRASDGNSNAEIDARIKARLAIAKATE
jgi:hypothetical protein